MPQDRVYIFISSFIFAFTIFLTSSHNAFAATQYYLSPSGNDANSGTSSTSPWRTIQKALDLAQPGDTINLAAGTYLQDLRTKRDGTSSAKITLQGPSTAVIKGGGNARIFEVNHDHYTLTGFTIDGLHGNSGSESGYRDKLLYVIGIQALNGVTGLKVDRMTFKNAGGECVRIRYFATNNEIANSTIQNCGVFDFRFNGGGKNGEGVYIGTAPEQWGANGAPTADPDQSNNNWVHDNTFNTQGNECVDIKEQSIGNIVERNDCTGQKDPNSGGMDSRGGTSTGGNTFRNNTIYGNVGAGIRFGGDTTSDGIKNDAYSNTITNNQAGGIKFMATPQGRVCGNTMSGNTGGNAVGTYASQFSPTTACTGLSPTFTPTAIITTNPSITTSPTQGPTVTITGLPGDGNNDNKVDGIDFVIWLNRYGQTVSGPSNGDFNNDGKNDGIDYTVWLTNYGKTVSSTATPTPTPIVTGPPIGQIPVNPTPKRVIQVNPSSIVSAITTAQPGDLLEADDGNYSFSVSNKNGTTADPIQIRAKNRGRANITGNTLEVKNSSYIVVEGFNFTTSSYTGLKIDSSNNIRVMRNRFAQDTSDSSKWLYIGGTSHHNRIDLNLFENKTDLGNFITIDGTTTQQSQYDVIAFNHFRNNGPRATNEKEAVRVGWSGISQSKGFTTVEYNLFENCDGDPEIISVKSDNNTVRHNTFLTSMGTLSQRHGDFGEFYGNFFLGKGKSGTGGIRVYGTNHKIYNNYFEGLTGTGYDAALQIDGGDVDRSGALNAHWRVYDSEFVHNTFVNNVSNIEIGKNYSLAPVNIKVTDNIILGQQIQIFKSPVNSTITNNINNAQLTLGNGIQKITSGSPGVNSATGNYAYVTDDMDGQTRVNPIDVGADEFASTTVTRRPLTASDVGPNSHISGGTPTPTLITTQTPTVTRSPSTTATTTPTPTGSATRPSQILNLTNWKITLPIPIGGSSPTEILQPQLASYSINPWFTVHASDGVQFRAPVNGATTSGSSYPRSELREMTNNGSSLASWSSTSGTHSMTIDQMVTRLPNTKPHLVVGQIHGGGDDVTVFRVEGTTLWITDGDSTHGYAVDTNFALNRRFTVGFEVSNGRIRYYYNGSLLPYTQSKSFSGAYFKAGAYTQANCSNSSPCSVDNYGEAVLYNVRVTH